MFNVTDKYKELISKPVRYTGIIGSVQLKSGDTIDISDSNVVKDSLKIIHKLNVKGDFRPGGVYAGELAIGLNGFDGATSDLDGSMFNLDFLLYHDSSMNPRAAEVVPLGIFYADGSSIKRKGKMVTLSAVDGLMLFDIPATAREGTLYQLAAESCSRAGVVFTMPQADFEAMPNGTMTAAVDTAIIQTERDLLMYIGIATGSFACITRYGTLVFIPLKAERTEGGVIIPVREIQGNVRLSTEFSDDTIRITKLFTQRNRQKIWSDLQVTNSGSSRQATLELLDNPLFKALTDAEVTEALNAELAQLLYCLNRAFDSDFTGDPALDIGDYVRLRGGLIDTARGYCTGMITSQVWRYRGKHTIKCSLSSSLAVSSGTVAVALAEDAQVLEPTERIQPKSLIEKRLDALENGSGGAGGNVVIIDHAPTSADLTGRDTVFVQYDPESTPVVEGSGSHIYNAMAVFVERSNAVNPNLLLNPDFTQNSLGQSTYTGSSAMIVDYWQLHVTAGTVYDVASKSFSFPASGGSAWYGIVYNPTEAGVQYNNDVIGHTVTLSARITTDVNIYVRMYCNTGETAYKHLIPAGFDSTVTVTWTIPSTVGVAQLQFTNDGEATSGGTVKIDWVNLVYA